MNEYGLIFDVDGVMADTEAVNAEATIQVFENLFGLKGVKRQDFEAGLGRGAEAYVQAAAKVHGFHMTDRQLSQAVATRQDYFMERLRKGSLPPFPGVMELLRAALNAEDLRLAIATSSAREKSQAVLSAAGIPYDRMVYLTGNDVAHKKPDPELYLRAAEALELPPSRCAVVEDAPDGVEAALAAGCSCFAVTNSVPPDRLQRAHRVVDSLKEVDLEAIRRMIDGRERD